MKVELPEFYIALALAKPNEPTSRDLEQLRLQTIEHLFHHVQSQYPTAVVDRIHLDFTNLEYGTDKPEPRFHVYWEAQAVVSFRSTETPDPNDLLECVLSAFDRNYLLHTVRQLQPSPLTSAVQVHAQRLKIATPGGIVQAPAFYMAFVCSNNGESSAPTAEEQDAFLTIAHAAATTQLQLEYGDDFQAVTLKIVKRDIGSNAGKPEAKFNLYVEFEAIATFAQNAPAPVDVFRILSGCLSMEFIRSLHAIGGRWFAFISEMVFKLCIFMEVPEVEEEEGDGDGDGDEEQLIIKVHIEFFVALVIRMFKVAPTQVQLEEFYKLIQDFFSARLASAFPKGFVDMVLEPDEHELEAGLPAPRFNSLHPFHATLQFYDPPPDGAKILSTIVQGTVGPLFDQIKTLSSPWNKSMEATLGQTVEKPPTDAAFGGMLELEEEIKEEETVVVVPPPEIPKPPQPKKKPIVVKQPEPKPASKEESPPPPPEEIEVGTSDVFASFTIPNCEWKPLRRDYKALAETTRKFYASHLQQTYGKAFLDVGVEIGRSLFGTENPNANYNVYMEWDITAKFSSDTPDAEIPTRLELCQSLVRADCRTYLLEHVRTLSETPFAGAVGMFTEQVNR